MSKNIAKRTIIAACAMIVFSGCTAGKPTIKSAVGTWRLAAIHPPVSASTRSDYLKTLNETFTLTRARFNLHRGKDCARPEYGLSAYAVKPGKKELKKGEDREIHSMYMGYKVKRTRITELSARCEKPDLEVNFEIIDKNELITIWNMHVLVYKRVSQ